MMGRGGHRIGGGWEIWDDKGGMGGCGEGKRRVMGMGGLIGMG